MSNEQKRGFFSRITKTSSTSDTADLPPENTAKAAAFDVTADSPPASATLRSDERKNEAGVQAGAEMSAAADPADDAEAAKAAETAEAPLYTEYIGRGIFKIPANSMLFSLWDEWQKKAENPQREAKLIMESPGILPAPMTDKEIEEEKQRLATKLLTEAKKRYRISHPQDGPIMDMDADALVYVAKSGLAAWLFLFPPIGNGHPITYENIQESVLSETVTYGVDAEGILHLPEQPEYFRLFLIARGVAMIPGKDGWTKEYFPHDFEKTLAVNDKGSVDYRSRANMQLIHAGDVIMEAFPPTTGTAGMTVLGSVIPPKNGKEVYLSGGYNTAISEDRMKLQATLDGHLQYRNGVFHVQPLYNVFGNVDYGVGNIEFPGDVHITGDVKNGFIVQAKGNIVIDGMVEGAVIDAGGDVIIRKGVLGDGRAVIKSQRSVTAQFLENCVVYAKDCVSASSILTANVYSDNEIVVRTGRGTIIGGKLSAGYLISATVIGSRSERLTELFVGDFPFVRQQREDLTRILQQTEKDIQAVEKNIQYLDVGDDVVEDVQKAMNRAQLLAKQRLQKNIFTIKCERLRKQLKDLEQKRIDIEQCRIISDMIYPVTRVKIGDIEQTIEQVSSYCSIHALEISGKLVLG